MTPHDFLDALRTYCALTGASVTSYGRTPGHNADPKIGGVKNSAHLYWLAADVVYDPPVPIPSVRTERARRLGLWLLAEGDHDHLQPLEWSKG